MSDVATTTERIGFLRRSIADELRAQAIGCTDGRGATHLRDAERCEQIAEGYERALLILFP